LRGAEGASAHAARCADLPEVVKFSLRSGAQNGGKNRSWTSYEKIREVIEKRIGPLPLSCDKQRYGCADQNQKSGQRRRNAYSFKHDHDASPDAIPWEQ
jgi:hypothetical protein